MILTERDLQEFNIDKLIDHSLKPDGAERFLRCLNFGILVQSINMRPTEPGNIKETVVNFTRFIIPRQIILAKEREAHKPIGMSVENFLKIKPIIEKLVASNYLKREWLDLYIA